MKTTDLDILNILLTAGFVNQRTLAEAAGVSLGTVNKALKALTEAGYVDGENRPTALAGQLAEERAPRSAVILAAGFGMRMVPINTQTPKGLMEIDGEPLIERQIRQLREAGIRDIRVVVGFMKEQYEYLIDAYGVHLTVNPDYAAKNNLHSLALVARYLHNCYVVPCDIWCRTNPFRAREMYGWYMVSEGEEEDSEVRVNRKRELVRTEGGGSPMLGIAYLTGEEEEILRKRLRQYDRSRRYDGAFWEEALYENGKMILPARVISREAAVEINTYEQLREMDEHSDTLRSDAIETAAAALEAAPGDIHSIAVLKKGMTNRSFLFQCQGKKYIMRVPGEGTDRLINRREEAAVYRTISGLGFCDDPVYINAENGYKITRFLEGVRVADPANEADVARCMKKLRDFHEAGLRVDHPFDIFGKIDFYEALWEGRPCVYRDYAETKAKVLSLRSWLERHARPRSLTHIDAVPDNFLFSPGKDGEEELQLTDWEYAGMQDPDVDLAMFSIYSYYDRERVDRLIDVYVGEDGCEAERRVKIYGYVAACGLLWSNWCEYKRNLGVEFGEYAMIQYRYAKDFSRLVREELARLGQCLEEDA